MFSETMQFCQSKVIFTFKFAQSRRKRQRLFLRMVGSPITRRQILDSSKLKEFADDNFKFDENGRKLSKQVENTVGKGGIARYEQFLLFPQCFQKACSPEASKGVIVWEWVNTVPRGLGYHLPGLTPGRSLANFHENHFLPQHIPIFHREECK